MSSRVMRISVYGLGLLAMVLSVQSGLLADANRIDAPEIDGSSISAGVGLLASSVLLLRARLGKK